MTSAKLKRPGKPDLAYVLSPAAEKGNHQPAVMFLCGYRSDMQGTKALYLEKQCRERGQACLRFDYSGHGGSDGKFEDGTIGAWYEDSLAALDLLPEGPVVLVGSSMGGWLALLVMLARPDRIRGLVGIAAAPDFTEAMFEALSPSQKQELIDDHRLKITNDYSDDPYVFTRKFYEDAKHHLFFKKQRAINIPVRLLQGQADNDVPWHTAGRIADTLAGPDIRVILIEDGDHRLSREEDLKLLDETVCEVSEKVAGERE